MSANGGGRGGGRSSRRRSRSRSGGGGWRARGGGKRGGGGGGEGGGRGGGGGRRSNGDPVIAEVMSENDIDPQDIPRAKVCGHFEPDNLNSIRGSERYFLVRGFAWYRQHEPPTGCTRKWASAHSWCVIDLKQQRIIHKYGQDCKTCGGKSTPSFNEEARRRMAEYVCKKYLYRTGRLRRTQQGQPDMTDLSGEREGPHDQSRCDMCKMLGHSCRSRAYKAEVRSDRRSDYQSFFYHYSRSADTQSESDYSSSPPSSPSPPPIVIYKPRVPSRPAPLPPRPVIRCTICGRSDHLYRSCTSQRYEKGRVSTTSQVKMVTTSERNRARPKGPTVLPQPVIRCTICGGTDHSYVSCTTQSRRSSTNRVQVSTASGISHARPRGFARVRAAFGRLGALLLCRRQ